MVCNKLMMNQEKTEFFIVASPLHYTRLQHLCFYHDGLEIPPSALVRNLGVVFDHSLTMSDHVTRLSRSLNWQIRNLNRIRRFLDFDACHNAVRALILSRLDYCCSLFNGISKHDLARLQRLQNKCARLIFKKPKRTHTSPLVQELHWLPVSKRIQYRTLLYVYKSLKRSSPDYLSSLLKIQESSYSLRSSKAPKYVVKRTSKHAGDCAFSVAGPRQWNALPISIRNAASIPCFSKPVKLVKEWCNMVTSRF